MNYKLLSSSAAILGTAWLLDPTAQAQSLTGNVGSAGVTEGERGAEFRVGLDDQGNAGSRLHYDQSFSDWYQLRLIGAFSRPDGGDWDYGGFTIENWFQWSEEADDDTGFNGGFRVAYGIADEGPDEVEARLTITDKFADGWEWRTNVIAEAEAGDNSRGGIDLEVRGQLSRKLNGTAFGAESWRLGGEVFAELGNSTDIPDFDDQAYQVGPVVKASWANGIYIQSAVRFGVTDGADDSMAKFFIGREF